MVCSAVFTEQFAGVLKLHHAVLVYNALFGAVNGRSNQHEEVLRPVNTVAQSRAFPQWHDQSTKTFGKVCATD